MPTNVTAADVKRALGSTDLSEPDINEFVAEGLSADASQLGPMFDT